MQSVRQLRGMSKTYPLEILQSPKGALPPVETGTIVQFPALFCILIVIICSYFASRKRQFARIWRQDKRPGGRYKRAMND